MANPRIDELKRRIEREPGSRLFAQLAEELRKDGDLAEAIRVARSGLAAHPNYPSARLTLGRALFDTGQFAPARVELEAVLRGAPDNILAARMLAECLEGLGDAGAALLQYRAALRLSPGDKQIEAQVRAIEQRLQAGGSVRTVLPPGRASEPPPPDRRAALGQGPASGGVSPAGPPSAPLAALASSRGRPAPPPVPSAPPRPSGPAPDDFDDVFEPAPSWKRTAPSSAAATDDAILLMEDEAPTLPGSPLAHSLQAGRPAPPEALAAPVTLAFQAPPVIPAVSPSPDEPASTRRDRTDATLAGAPAFPLPPLPRPGEGAIPSHLGTSTAAFAAFSEANARPAAPEPIPVEPALWEWERPANPGASMDAATPHLAPPRPLSQGGLEQGGPPARVPPPSPQSDAARVDSTEVTPDAPLSTATLAELYFDQGFLTKAILVYEQILEREPHNERARARLIEVKALARPLDVPPAADPRAAQRLVLARKIARLEQVLAAVRRG